jgi:serine/threonine protein kinase
MIPPVSTSPRASSNMAIPATVPQFPAASDAAEYGDFVDSDDDYEVTEYTECPYGYKFYPIQIGEVIDQTYRIDHKLGHGGFSTVWMAHDLKNRRDVALKIMAAGNSGEYEYNILEEIKRAVKDTSHLVTCIATLFLRGKDSNHQVLVFPLRGPSLDSLVGREILIATRMSAARQLLEALASLHEGGIVHRGK